MSAGGAANGVIFLRPLEGKKDELEQFLIKNLRDIRNNVAGVVIAFYFWSDEKQEFIVVESFESTQAMFEYGNSQYHEGMVAKVIELGVTPIQAFTDQSNAEELKDFRTTGQAAHFDV